MGNPWGLLGPDVCLIRWPSFSVGGAEAVMRFARVCDMSDLGERANGSGKKRLGGTASDMGSVSDSGFWDAVHLVGAAWVCGRIWSVRYGCPRHGRNVSSLTPRLKMLRPPRHRIKASFFFNNQHVLSNEAFARRNAVSRLKCWSVPYTPFYNF
ncbi:uncharacterized protein [Physcomitrium patens]|uniref:uncharacterized protein isoform X1 n=1 Tax=Physcomitrium patens TaxID=3218 RepID=UPI003CCCA60D